MHSEKASNSVVANLVTIAVLAVSFLIPAMVHAQAAGATLSGMVTDPSSAAVPNSNVSIKNTETGISRDVTTNEAGFYNAPNLSPGTYEVSVSAPGFSKLVQPNITLTVGAQQVLNLSLQVGEVTQTLVVPGDGPNVELTSSALTAEVNSVTVRELPLNGRDWSSLAVLQPGTIGIRTQIGTTGTVNRGNRGFGNQLSISGHRPTENNYRVNGISVNDYSNGSPGSVQGAQLGVDAIQEFSVLTANYTAEYGRTSGGVINAITRPGTNNFHGSAYWFLRDEGLDAKSFFDTTKSPFHRNQFGGSAGGPIQKDKTFIFGDYEAIRQVMGLNSVQLVVPSPAARGIGPNGQPAVAVVNGSPLPASGPGAAPNPDPTTHIDRSVLPYLAFYPLPNAGVNGDTGLFVSSPVQQYSENYATARLDHKFSDKDSVDLVWFFDRSPQITPDAFLESRTQTFSERVLGEVEETHVFSSSVVNNVRFGYSRTNGLVGQPVDALLPIAADTTLGVVPNRPAPILGVSGLATAQGSLGSQTRNNHTQNSYQFYDDAFITKGSHALKLGFSVEGLQYNELSVQRPNGTFNFDSLASFLTNRPTNFILGDPNNSIELGNRIKFFGVYFQDDWHVRSNLTFNLGLRYEPGTLPKEAHNRFTVVQNIYGGQPTAVPSLYQSNPTLKDVEPRVGFAWDPFHNGKTSVRGGFGIFDVLPGPWESNIQESGSFPFAQTVSAGNLAPGAFPTLTGVTLGANRFQAYAPDQNPKTNYALNWNLSVQREITRTLTATVGYVGSHTLHSPFTTDDSNQVLPTRVAGLGDLFPCGAPILNGRCTTGGGTIIDPNVGQLRPTFYGVEARYAALEAQLRKSLSHGLQLQGSYTWSKCYDNSSSGDIGDPYQNSLSSLPFFASLDRLALCDFNITHNFVGNWIWDVPSPPKSASAIVSRLGGGWELGGIITASTGSPFTPILGGDPLGQNSSDPFDFPSRVQGCNPVAANYRSTLQYLNLSCFTPPTAPASFTPQCADFTGAATPPPSGLVYCRNLFGNSARNSVIGPGLFDWDFSIYKNNYFPRISESFNLQFRAEFFNVLNHTNFQSPLGNSALFTATGAAIQNAGVLDTVATNPREIQLTLKAIW